MKKFRTTEMMIIFHIFSFSVGNAWANQHIHFPWFGLWNVRDPRHKAAKPSRFDAWIFLWFGDSFAIDWIVFDADLTGEKTQNWHIFLLVLLYGWRVSGDSSTKYSKLKNWSNTIKWHRFNSFFFFFWFFNLNRATRLLSCVRLLTAHTFSLSNIDLSEGSQGTLFVIKSQHVLNKDYQTRIWFLLMVQFIFCVCLRNYEFLEICLFICFILFFFSSDFLVFINQESNSNVDSSHL